MIAQQDRLYKDVKFLTELRPYRNYQNLESLEKVCAYIRDEFKSLGLMVQNQQWKAKGQLYTNVIGCYNPNAKNRLIVGAHYDVCGDQPGADDNASAVAGLLETARLLAEQKPQLDYRIELVAYCLEEPPFFSTNKMGSYIHAKSLKDSAVDVMGMICYEMIGYFSEQEGSQEFPHPALAQLYPSKGNFIIVVGQNKFSDFSHQVHQLMKQEAQIDVQHIDFPNSNSLAGLSDHRNYWKMGYPAVMINNTSFLRNPHYHQSSDRIETLDFEKMTAVVDATYQAVVGF